MRRRNTVLEADKHKQKKRNPFIAYMIGGTSVILIACSAFSFTLYKTNMMITKDDANEAVKQSSFYKQVSVKTIKNKIEQDTVEENSNSPNSGNNASKLNFNIADVDGLAQAFLDHNAADSPEKATAMAVAYEVLSKQYSSTIGIAGAANIRGEGSPGLVQYGRPGFDGWTESSNAQYGHPVYVTTQVHVNAIINTCNTLKENNHTGVGICQWTWYTRLLGVAQKYQECGESINDYATLCSAEINFMISELQAKNYSWLASNDYNEATARWCIEYEAPSNAQAHAIERQAFALPIIDALSAYSGG